MLADINKALVKFKGPSKNGLKTTFSTDLAVYVKRVNALLV